MKKTKKNKKTKNNLNFNFIHKYKFIIFIMFFGVAGALLLSLTRASEQVTVDIDRSQVIATSNFRTGMTITHDTYRYNSDPGAISKAQELVANSTHYANVHVMGFGPSNPSPSPGVYDWSTLDKRMQTHVAAGKEVVLTACCSPGWMKNAPDFGTDPTGKLYVEYAPLPEHYDDYAKLIGAAVKRYPQIKHVQVWNEMKGFWDSSKNRWNYEGYTQLYNLIWDEVKAIRPEVKIGGPYVVVSSNGGGKSFDSSVKEPWGTLDQRPLDVITYWLKNKKGADFITVDGKNENKDGVEMVDAFARTEKFTTVAKWIRSLDNTQYPGAKDLPIWWAEWYPNASDNQTASTHEKTAVMSTAFIHTITSGASTALVWNPEGDANGNSHPRGLFFSTAEASGGTATEFHAVQKAIHDYFGVGQKILKSTSSSTKVKVLATATKVMLVNTTASNIDVVIDGTTTNLPGFAVRVIDTPPELVTPPQDEPAPTPEPEDNTPPRVEITSPQDNTISRRVFIEASSSDTDVVRIELYIDDTLVKSDTANSIKHNWNLRKESPGSHTVSVSVYDQAGNVGTDSTTFNVE